MQCIFIYLFVLMFQCINFGFSCGSEVKNLPAMQEAQIWSLGWEEPLEKVMVTHSTILAWRIPWTGEPGRLQFIGLQRIRHNWVTFTSKYNTWYFHIHAFLFQCINCAFYYSTSWIFLDTSFYRSNSFYFPPTT